MMEKIIRILLTSFLALILCMTWSAVAIAATPIASTDNAPTSSEEERLIESKKRNETLTVKQFDLSAREYIDAFNKKYGSIGMTLEADQTRDDCWLTINDERTDIRIQFCDKVNGPWTTGSGLDMENGTGYMRILPLMIMLLILNTLQVGQCFALS